MRPPNPYSDPDFPAIAAVRDYCLGLAQASPTAGSAGKSGLMRITAVEPFQLMGQHGIVIIWSDSAVPTGYAADAKAVSGHIPAPSGSGAPGSIITGNLQSLQFADGQFAQLRIRPKWFATVTGAVDDYDIIYYNPVGSQRGFFQYNYAVHNAMAQSQDPGDSIVAPAQGANVTLPAVFPALSPWRLAQRTEQLVLEQGTLRVQINNNGAGATSGGAIGLEISGYVYNFEGVDVAGETTHLMKNVDIALPVDCVPNEIVPIQFGVRQPW